MGIVKIMYNMFSDNIPMVSCKVAPCPKCHHRLSLRSFFFLPVFRSFDLFTGRVGVKCPFCGFEETVKTRDDSEVCIGRDKDTDVNIWLPSAVLQFVSDWNKKYS